MLIKLSKLETAIKIQFKNKELLQNVFIHRSYLNEHKNFRLQSNENMEFLGDSVLSLITSVYLYRTYPALHEGDYTEIKSSIVKTESLANSAKDLNLGDYMMLSIGEEQGSGRSNKNILADCFEALIAAIFLDQNFESAYNFVVTYLFTDKLTSAIIDKSYLSAKGMLQEYIQGKYKTIPIYKVLEEKGPEHNRVFKIGVFFQNKNLGIGVAPSKKEAEEKAAKLAFDNLKGI